jgi:hypothetical protein
MSHATFVVGVSGDDIDGVNGVVLYGRTGERLAFRRADNARLVLVACDRERSAAVDGGRPTAGPSLRCQRASLRRPSIASCTMVFRWCSKSGEMLLM